MGLLLQVCTLLWKNYLLQKRRCCISLIEMFLPVLLILLIVLLRMVVKATEHPQPKYHLEQEVSFLFMNKIVGYTPGNSELDKVMKYVENKVNYYLDINDFMSHLIVFDVPSTITELPHDVSFTIRPSKEKNYEWNTDHTYRYFETDGAESCSHPLYATSGVVFFQHAIGEGCANYWAGRKGINQTLIKSFGLYIKCMAFPPYSSSPFPLVLQGLFPLFLVLSFLPVVVISTKNLVHEKERKLKESMKLMGLSSAAYWISWLITICVSVFPATIIISLLLGLHIVGDAPVLAHSDASLFCIFMICYAIALITFCFMVSTFVQKANIAAVISGVLFFIFYIPYSVLSEMYDDLTRVDKLGASLLFNSAMGFGALCIGMYEGTEEGARWDTFHRPAVVDDNVSLLDFIIMLLIDSVIHFLIAWYIDNIWPGESGVPQPYNFCFTKSYWYPNKIAMTDDYRSEVLKSAHFEKEPTGREIGIEIRNLKKWSIFKNRSTFQKFGNKWAVAGTSLNIYQGQITVLLGHNGAGKTTTLSMLTGMIPPTSGTAIINGCDIRKNIVGARSSLGLCPQHNILFDFLTVREHLIFFLKLRDMYGSWVDHEMNEMIATIGLVSKMNTLSKNLSGGQKRKLSVGNALIGNSKVVILDEPTSGMDPAARRQIWSLLQEARHDRTILLTTHFLDEADVLGDRIAIMADGAVKCCGSSLFLKKLFGTGYHLVIVKTSGCDIHQLTFAIRSFVPSAELQTVTSSEVSYLLPDNESSKFPQLFSHLDTNKHELKIISFGTSATTMEDVFLKVGEYVHNEDEPPADTAADIRASVHHTSVSAEMSKIVSLLPEESSVKPDVSPSTSHDELKLGQSSKSLGSGVDNESHSQQPEESSVKPDVSPSTSHDELKLGQSSKSLGSGVDNESHSQQSEVTKPGENNAIMIEDKESGAMNLEAGDILAFNRGFSKKTGLRLVISHIHALFMKRMIYTWRNRTVTIFQLLMPIAFTALGLYNDTFLIKERQDPPLTFNLQPFGETIIPYTDGLAPTNTDAKFINIYKEQFGDSHKMEYFKMSKYQNFDNYTVRRAAELGRATFNKKMVIGMQIVTPSVDPFRQESVAAIAYFNFQPFNSLPVAVHYLVNSFVQLSLGDSYSLQATVHPLPETKKHVEKSTSDTTSGSFAIALYISLGMAFLTTLFIFFLIKERQVGAKHLQTASGVDPLTYWLATFLWDFINYIIPSLLLIGVFAAYNKQAFMADNRWKILFLILAVYGWAMLPFMYFVQFTFKSPANGVAVVILLNIVSGIITTITVSVLENPIFKREKTTRIMDFIFKIVFPNYNMASCFMRMNSNYGTLKFCEPYINVCAVHSGPCCAGKCAPTCLKFNKDYLGWQIPGIGSYLAYMGAQGGVFFLAVLIIEYQILQKIWYVVSEILQPNYEMIGPVSLEDSDVANEIKYINSTEISLLKTSNSLLLVNLFKKFANVIVVNHICVGIPEKECFGLLGANGAGKTTTFKMLTGDIMPAGGNAYVKGYDICSNIRHVQANMGYCPQFDALIDQMTGFETLTMFARLRGIPEGMITRVVQGLTEILLLGPHINKLVGHYSGGNKRKLSTAVALIGDPPLILLDEPTSGMDPNAKRHLWNILTQIRDSGRTLVLTSHSMEECDALCTRIAIMVNGKFVCLGSPQLLKNKFAQGYTLIIQLKLLEDGTVAPNKPVIDYISSHFPGAQVFDDHEGYIHFQVPESSASLADIFSSMEETKTALNVKDYSVHQTTLEQVFLAFVKSQRPTKE